MKAKKTLLVLAGTLLGLGLSNLIADAQEGPGAEPEIVEIETISCRDLLKMEGEEEEFTIVFLHGFMSGKTNDTTFNIDPLATATDRIMDHCIDNPEDSLLTVFEQYRTPSQ